MTTAADVLDRAAELVERRWCQKVESKSVDGRVDFCCLSAIYESARYSEADWRQNGNARLAVRNLLKLRTSDESIVAYNDDPGRTQADVVQLLRDAADDAQKGCGA